MIKMFKEPIKYAVTKRLLKRKDVQSWPDEAKEEFAEMVSNLIDLYGTQGFITGRAKKPFQDELIRIKNKYNLP